MKKYIYLAFISLIISSCGNTVNERDENGEDNLPAGAGSQPKQFNVSILLDLSDRVIQPLEPKQKDRDIQIIQNVIRVIKERMKDKGAFLSKDKIRILFNPTPKDPNINNIAKNLNADFSTKSGSDKKTLYDNIEEEFTSSLNEIYEQTIKTNDWNGSDVWRFFKNDVNDFCVERDTSYKNILILLTDGYIFDSQSQDRKENRTQYITENYFEKEGLRKPNWKEEFEKKDYGLMSVGQSYKNLSVLVLEVNPSAKHKDDEDVIRAFLGKWFDEMSINNFRIYNTDLPENTKKRIEDFFN